jgi:hypothetical protein
MEFFKNMDTLLQIFWYMAIPVTIIFLSQMLLTFLFPADHETYGTLPEADSDFQPSTFKVFTSKNLINFLLGFSWTGISFYQVVPNKAVLLGMGLFVGLAFVGLFFLIIIQIQKFTEDQTFNLKSVLGRNAKVCLTIPEQKDGVGKIGLKVKGIYREFKAVTEGNSILPGSWVKIMDIESDGLVLVSSTDVKLREKHII